MLTYKAARSMQLKWYKQIAVDTGRVSVRKRKTLEKTMMIIIQTTTMMILNIIIQVSLLFKVSEVKQP